MMMMMIDLHVGGCSEGLTRPNPVDGPGRAGGHSLICSWWSMGLL